ncbi:hypothetical protein CDLVIII_4950 [Clostridium sp. DL-VIII]|nr:hypothetical protein [Clostridium sp. DL-VIII]EHJ01441.1 hypothetical protein CDLVIII_4950 [Clostridium sp. DL-VIII]
MKCFRAFFKFAANEEIVENNPMLNICRLRDTKTLIHSFTDKISI